MSEPPLGQVFSLARKPIVDRVWIGALCWLAAGAAFGLGLIDQILLGAPLIIVPLALDLIRPQFVAGLPGRFFALALRLQLPAALALVVAMALERGAFSAALAIPWLLFTLIAGATGIAHALWWRAATGRVPPVPELGHDLGLSLISIGGAWTVLYLSGRPIGAFSDEIIQLTAVHFHYAGFALPIIGSQAMADRPHRGTSAILWLLLASVMLVAIGIAMSPLVEVVGSTALVLVALCFAGLQLRAAFASKIASGLLAISAVSLATGAALAIIYAWGEWFTTRPLEIPVMAATHGITMSGGFSLCGILGWKARWHHRKREKAKVQDFFLDSTLASY